MASTRACHARDRSSILRERVFLRFCRIFSGLDVFESEQEMSKYRLELNKHDDCTIKRLP